MATMVWSSVALAGRTRRAIMPSVSPRPTVTTPPSDWASRPAGPWAAASFWASLPARAPCCALRLLLTSLPVDGSRVRTAPLLPAAAPVAPDAVAAPATGALPERLAWLAFCWTGGSSRNVYSRLKVPEAQLSSTTRSTNGSLIGLLDVTLMK